VSTPRKIIVGADGSLDSLRAVAWAAELAKAIGCEVIAVHALGLLVHLENSTIAPSEDHRAEVRALLDEKWTEPLRVGGVVHRNLVLDGNPVTALMTAADEEDADLMVVGSRGTGGFAGLQLGSTSLQLVQHSSRPVVVVPGPR